MSDKEPNADYRRTSNPTCNYERQRMYSESSRVRKRSLGEVVRRSRSRSCSGRGDGQQRTQGSRRRSPARDRRHSSATHRQLRSRSISSTRTLLEQECELSREREKLRTLENQVRKERERLTERNRSRRRFETPEPGPSNLMQPNAGNKSPTRYRSLVSPAKRHTPSVENHETHDNKKTKFMTTDLFEDFFLKLFKSKAGDRESFSSSTLNNVVPDFDPMSKEQTIHIWLDKVDECSEIYNWNDKQTVHYALPKLTGLAKTWFQGLPSIKHTWLEWKSMLKESFPATENYAELLTDMLNRRVRSGESYELYYFAKINLLNRCKIFGKQAVDCLLYGVEDRGVRVGAQAAKFDKPEDVLEFFKTIKYHSRNQSDFNKDFNKDKRSSNTSTGNSSAKNIDNTASNKSSDGRGQMKCFNCQGVGHPSFKCPKPIVKCTNCNFMGHDSSHCPKLKDESVKT